MPVRCYDDGLFYTADVDGDLLGFINPSLTMFSADEEAMTSCDVTSEMTLSEDIVDVTLLADDELRVKTEPVEMDDTAPAMTDSQSGNTSPIVTPLPHPNVAANPFSTNCSKLLLFKGFSAILV